MSVHQDLASYLRDPERAVVPAADLPAHAPQLQPAESQEPKQSPPAVWTGMELFGATSFRTYSAEREAMALPDLRKLSPEADELQRLQTDLRLRIEASPELRAALVNRVEHHHPLAHLEYNGTPGETKHRTFYTLHDIFMESARSNLTSSMSPDISSPLSPTTHARIPLLQAPMNYITPEINQIFVEQGGFAMGHRWMTPQETLEMIARHPQRAIAVVGCDPVAENFELAKSYLEAGAVGVLVDVNISWTTKYLGLLKKISDLKPEILIAGNVDHPEAVLDLFLAGATVVKLGVGPGSHCKTRDVTPIGRPQGSNISACAFMARLLGMSVIADGGVQSGGRYATMALGLGADFVMKGRIYASTDQGNLEKRFFPGDWVLSKSAQALKLLFSNWSVLDTLEKRTGYRMLYHGMAEKKFQDRTMKGKERPGQGWASWVTPTGDLESLLKSYADEIKVGTAATGSANLETLRKVARFGLVSDSYSRESGHRTY